MDACRFEPASVKIIVPLGKSNAAKPTLPGIAAPRSRQRNRPAIIRCTTMKRSSSRDEDDALPHPAQAQDLAAREIGRRGLDRADDKRIAQP